jgi:hypothetical protein
MAHEEQYRGHVHDDLRRHALARQQVEGNDDGRRLDAVHQGQREEAEQHVLDSLAASGRLN